MNQSNLDHQALTVDELDVVTGGTAGTDNRKQAIQSLEDKYQDLHKDASDTAKF